ncbi:hypothetical protein FZC66_18815 [Priestia megaterium]|nr:hypothetical protein FZC66_18815 [Priestia megaterium]
MKSYFLSLSTLLVFLLCSLAVLLYHASKFLLVVDLIILSVSVLLMSLFTSSRNYLYVLAISLLLGFSFLFYAFFQKSESHIQVNLMIQHLLITTSLVLIWLLFAHIRRIYEENVTLKQQVNELKKFEHLPHLLSYSEFINRASVIMTGVKRRGEESYFIRVHASASDEVKGSVIHVVTEAILQTVRADFDLVTLIHDQEILIFLQNTNEEGCHIVLNRLSKTLRSQFNVIELPISYEFLKAGEDVVETLHELVSSIREVG